MTSPRRSAGRYFCFCSSVPWTMRVGPTKPVAIPPGRGARAWASSQLKMNCSMTLMPAPPYSLGQAGATRLREASFFIHSRLPLNMSMPRSLGASAWTNSRTSCRNFASSGVSRKSIALPSVVCVFCPAILARTDSNVVRYFGGLARIAPHEPDAGATFREIDLVDHAEAVGFIERDVLLPGAFEVGGDAAAVATLEHRRHKLRADAESLVVRIDAEDTEVVVRLPGVQLVDDVERRDHGRHAA